jgi:hypothetical protein
VRGYGGKLFSAVMFQVLKHSAAQFMLRSAAIIGNQSPSHAHDTLIDGLINKLCSEVDDHFLESTVVV